MIKRLFAYIRRKRKEHTAKKYTFERIVQNYSDEWTESKHRAFYAFLWSVINPNDMEGYIVMFEAHGVPTEGMASDDKA